MQMNNGVHRKTLDRKSRRRECQIRPTLPDFALSEIVNRQATPATPIAEVIENIKREWVKIHERQPRRRKVLIAGLLDFEIFRSPAIKWAYELSSLHLLVKRKKELYFNGTIQLGEVKQYVEDVEIESHSIEGYGDAENPGVVIYVQPKCASKDSDFDVWFRLHEPAPRYSRFHEPFLWIASFARHVLDYVENQPPKSVRLEGFHTKFSRWINARFGCNAAFKAWHAMYGGKSDFRLALNAHVDYIYQQACDLDNSSDLLAHPVWSHCMQGSEHIKRQAVTIKETIATPHVYACFAHMYFGEKLQPVQPCRSVRHEQAKRKRRLGFASDSTTSAPKSQFGSSHPSQALSIRAGDVIAFKPEEKDKQYWKKTEKEWYAYVQRVEPLSDGTERLFVLWIYRPDETNMFLAHYPIKKEVFLSDNCNCDEGILLSSDVSRKLTVNWLPEALDTSSDILIRQTYITQESSFVTLQNAHLKCACHQKKTPAINLRPGDTLYITKSFKGNKILEPVLVYKIDEQLQQVTVRMFLRLGRDCADTTGRPQRAIAPNELVLTDELVKVRFSRIERPCNIRLVFESETVSGKIPFPYDRGGAGDFWFLSMGLQKKDGVCKLVHLSRLPTPFKEGSNFVDNEMQKLHGLSIFSGGGNLDRGLEEGGAVEFKTAVDFSAEAIHTQRANSRDPEKTEFFCGSVDDHLAAIFSGRIPLPDVQLASAGSPCPGFSVMQQDFLSPASLSNASHISTFCSYVDVIRPKYGILENVVNMASTRTGFENQNVMSQLVACLVSLGYQVNQFIMDAWTCGSAQHRSRVFLVIAAPGLALITQPKHTHSMPYEDTIGRSLGYLPNGQKFGEREHYPTPFPIVTAGEVNSDLPDIGNGGVQICVSHPDHQLSSSHNRADRALIERIPVCPPGSGYVEAHRRGLIPLALQKANKKEIGRSFQRVKEHGLMPTIMTGISPQNGRGGATLHWSEPRPMTIQEARRAQGYLDSEVIIGSPLKRWTIVGNGVDRKVSLALGFSLYKAAVASQGNESATVTSTEELRQLLNGHEIIAPASSSKTNDFLTDEIGANDCNSSTESETDILNSSQDEVLVKKTPQNREQRPLFQPNGGQARSIDESEDELVRPTPARKPPSAPETHSKRNYELSLEDHPSASSLTLTKRVRTELTISTSSSKPSPKHNHIPPFTLDTSPESSADAQGNRRTRLSGLQVEFVPNSWDRRPEYKCNRTTATETRLEASTESSKSVNLANAP